MFATERNYDPTTFAAKKKPRRKQPSTPQIQTQPKAKNDASLPLTPQSQSSTSNLRRTPTPISTRNEFPDIASPRTTRMADTLGQKRRSQESPARETPPRKTRKTRKRQRESHNVSGTNLCSLCGHTGINYQCRRCSLQLCPDCVCNAALADPDHPFDPIPDDRLAGLAELVAGELAQPTKENPTTGRPSAHELATDDPAKPTKENTTTGRPSGSGLGPETDVPGRTYSCYFCEESLTDVRYECQECADAHFCDNCRDLHRMHRIEAKTTSGVGGLSNGQDEGRGVDEALSTSKANLGSGTGTDFVDGSVDTPAGCDDVDEQDHELRDDYEGRVNEDQEEHINYDNNEREEQDDKPGSHSDEPESDESKSDEPGSNDDDDDDDDFGPGNDSRKFQPSEDDSEDDPEDDLDDDLDDELDDKVHKHDGSETLTRQPPQMVEMLETCLEAFSGAVAQSMAQTVAMMRSQFLGTNHSRRRKLNSNTSRPRSLLDFDTGSAPRPPSRRQSSSGRRQWTPHDQERLAKLVGKGTSLEEIAAKLDRSVGAVQQQWRKQQS
ncbi:Uu.00g104730.m01.CDS01 [Anthostomella pinea]|uniref:Uu.00g104730.m01.CDS01 n=1 Tax=Anthostomella pinea TaxID=933095 RepID=A0AAI8VEB2_9PEZI|nr:Uu.00g104730.m01.CDS01 [Anthostomella pinea]